MIRAGLLLSAFRPGPGAPTTCLPSPLGTELQPRPPRAARTRSGQPAAGLLPPASRVGAPVSLPQPAGWWTL